LYKRVGDNWRTLAYNKSAGITVPEGSAQIMLVVIEKKVYFYVNGEKIASANDAALKPGKLSLTLLSGTNKDFGTRCQMTDLDLWIIQ
jgi:hypothetical protein